ncbi:hypothetical protein [Paenibacillus glacialis]|uniref:Prophage tail endopeptidase domain-containing protein n=1 Tax=Paenibacillus glacialis TaxID=494026 RepID=A0A168NNP3_9BACL|nr:hypothetical protein [Paenibacillus glacialis]OAB45972.1 hypothetical protein PGLA_00825 [Paenibacillus glacialis]
MSLACLMGNEKRAYFTADTRECATVDGQLYQMNDNAKKIFNIDNKIIFISGYSALCKEVIEDFEVDTDHSIERLQDIIKEHGRSFETLYPNHVDILGAGYMDCTVVTSVKIEDKYQNILYNFNSTNNFELFEYPITKKDGYIFATAGVLGQEATDIGNSLKEKLDPVDVFKTIYNKLSCEAVGGSFEMYEFDNVRGVISHNTYKIEDKKELLKYEDYKPNNGHYILGNKLQISDDRGTLTIEGNLLTITDDSKKTKVQLGEYTKGSFGLKLYGPKGDVVLDENGIVQVDSIQVVDNVDSSHGLKLKFYVDDGMISIRKVMLNITLERFRAHSKGALSKIIDLNTTRSERIDLTTTLERSFASKSTLPENVSGNTETDGTYISGVGGHNHGIPDGTQLLVSGGRTVSWSTSGGHRHPISLNSHSHSFTVPAHSHDISMPEHAHSISMPSHSHDIDYGIYESSYATGVRISIDGVIRGGTYSSSENTVDITQWITTTGWHTIELTSTQLGRINASLYVKSFVGF